MKEIAELVQLEIGFKDKMIPVSRFVQGVHDAEIHTTIKGLEDKLEELKKVRSNARDYMKSHLGHPLPLLVIVDSRALIVHESGEISEERNLVISKNDR